MLFYLLVLAVNSLAPLEPEQSGLMIGSWYDRLHGDTPQKTHDRYHYFYHRCSLPPFSIWQSDMNITKTLQTDFIHNFTDQVDALSTDAILYITLYPIEGFSAVSTAAINDFAAQIKNITSKGRKVMIRYASEMNGNCTSS
jgi:hypothetical protein